MSTTALAKREYRPVENHPSCLTLEETSLVRSALDILASKRIRELPHMQCLEDFHDYLRLRFAGCTNEQGHVLYLNTDRRLLAGEAEFLGDQKSVLFDLRRIIFRAVQLGADHLVFAHNHPSENAKPSDADVRCLDHWERILPALSLNILDSYVVTSHRVVSIKEYRKSELDAECARHKIEWERRSHGRRAKLAATRAAKRAAAAQGASA